MAETKTILRTWGLCKEYRVGSNVVKALDGVDLDVRAGEFLSVTGRSGSGKSTLLSLLAGLESPSNGSIDFLGRRMEELDEKERLRFRRAHIGFVFQLYNLLPQYTTLENVALPLVIRGLPRREREALAWQALRLVGLTAQAGHKPTELSGGEQQRAGLARAIITKPEMVFADEPTGNLDARTSREIMDLLSGIFRDWGTTFILVSHDQTLQRYTDRGIELSDGRIVGAAL